MYDVGNEWSEVLRGSGTPSLRNFFIFGSFFFDFAKISFATSYDSLNLLRCFAVPSSTTFQFVS